jgi:hypothetical protein
LTTQLAFGLVLPKTANSLSPSESSGVLMAPHRHFALLREVEQRFMQYPDTILMNMDQVSVQYGDAGQITIEVCGSRSVQARTGFLQNDRVTVALTVSSNGDKLKPLVVFKGTRNG